MARFMAMPDALATIDRMLPSSDLASVGPAPVAVDVLARAARTVVIGATSGRSVTDERSGRC
jgi:hypothetical protein